jgi:hypothetical protein
MMKKIPLIILFVLFYLFILYAQNKIELDFSPGVCIINSENSMRLLEEENESYDFFLSFGLNYQRNDVYGFDLLIEYNYRQETLDKVYESYWTDETGQDLGKVYGDLRLINHSFDFDYIKGMNQNFSYGLGLSFVLTNRIFRFDRTMTIADDWKVNLYDRLASSGLGANAFLEFTIPFGTESDFIFISRFKIRYTHSIWFDEGLRKLDDYYQEFLTTELSLGIGYKF